MSRLIFPDGFLWGAATASYQIEGAWKADDKGESIWDRFSHTPGRVLNGDTGDVACDHYHRFREDVALMRELNLGSYRFSLSWPRIQPGGKGAGNQAGLDFYKQLCDELLDAGIRPFATLYHWDLPQELEDAGGWPERDLAGRFADYAELVARELGDRVRVWSIFNEPKVFTTYGYLFGTHAPGRRDLLAFLRASHVVNLAQGQAFAAMKAHDPALELGSAFNLSPCEPAGDGPGAEAASERWHGFVNEWFLRPTLLGEYPEAFVEGVPSEAMGIEEDDLDTIQVPLDFVGVNLYTRTLVEDAPDDPFLGAREASPNGGDQGDRTDFDWEVWPDALRAMLVRLSKDFDHPILEVTENGCSYGDGPGTDGLVRDERRIDFYRGSLEALHAAIEEGAKVRAYHAWSLLDNFEWAEGYTQRFGLIHVDFETAKRTIKQSGHWYAQVADENGLLT